MTAAESDVLDVSVAGREQVDGSGVHEYEEVGDRIEYGGHEVGLGNLLGVLERHRIGDQLGHAEQEAREDLDGQHDQSGEQIEAVVESGGAEGALELSRVVGERESDERVGDTGADVGAHYDGHGALHARYDAGADHYDGDGGRGRGVLHESGGDDADGERRERVGQEEADGVASEQRIAAHHRKAN